MPAAFFAGRPRVIVVLVTVPVARLCSRGPAIVIIIVVVVIAATTTTIMAIMILAITASAGVSGVNIDRTAPTAAVSGGPAVVTADRSAHFDISGSDALAGVEHLEYRLDGGGWTVAASTGISPA